MTLTRNVLNLFKENDFGVSEISIKDDGVGFSIAEAEALFTSLGGSWKSKKRENGRRKGLAWS